MAGIRIYTDENVRTVVAEGLRRRNVDAFSAREVGNLGLQDAEQLTYAAQNHAVLFTHDRGFVVRANQWKEAGRDHWGVIYVHQQTFSVGELIRHLKDYADILEAEDMKNMVEYL